MKLSRTLIAFLPILLCCACLSMACDDDDEDDAPAVQNTAATTSLTDDAPKGEADRDVAVADDSGSNELVTLSEPTENAFTIQMPKGWRNEALLIPANDQKRPMATSQNPGGDTLLFFGDPKIPAFTEPTPQLNENSALAKFNPLMKFARYQPAKVFFTNYVTRKFGKLPGFRFIGAEPNPDLDKSLRAQAQNQKMAARYTTTLLRFDYEDQGKPVHAQINGLTLSMGTIWVADISGVSTTGDPNAYHDLVLQIAQSFKTNPEWQAKQQALSRAEHERRMAMIQAGTDAMTRRHLNNMANIRASGQRHQARMDAIHAAGDAQVRNWNERQARGDASHQQFLNYIKGEETVVNPGGQSFQVETGHDRYYQHKSNNTYIGTDSTKDLDDLRKGGVNPDDYQEVKIRRP